MKNQISQKVQEIIQKAKETGDEVFIASLSPEQLRKADFTELSDPEEFWKFDYVDISLFYDEQENVYKLKYRFWESDGQFTDYYEKYYEKKTKSTDLTVQDLEEDIKTYFEVSNDE